MPPSRVGARLVGWRLGVNDGDIVGTADDGDRDGTGVGAAEGMGVGAAEGISVGVVGAAEGMGVVHAPKSKGSTHSYTSLGVLTRSSVPPSSHSMTISDSSQEMLRIVAS